MGITSTPLNSLGLDDDNWKILCPTVCGRLYTTGEKDWKMLKNNADDWDFVVRGNSWRLILLNHPHSKMCQTQFLRIRSSIEIQDIHSQQKSHFQKIYRPHQNLICSCNFLQPNHGLRTPRESFFSKIPNFWAWADKLGRKILGHLGYFQRNYQPPFWDCVFFVHVFH